MLEVQKYLKNNTLEDLSNTYGIVVNKHEDGRVILNYDQIESHKFKTNPIVKECRSLVLDANKDYALVARSFDRFFNLGEEKVDFDWNNFTVQHKEDGSLILLYYHNGWKVNTRGSFAESSVMGHEVSWNELVRNLLPYGYWEWKRSCTYVFELCTNYNQVVVRHNKPRLVLLSIFEGEHELPFSDVEDFSKDVNCELVKTYDCKDLDSVKHFVSELSKEEVNEGVVIRDVNNNRLKIKNELYVNLHRLNNNGNISSSKALIPIVLLGEEDEVVAYFPELSYKVNLIKQAVKEIVEEITLLGKATQNIKDKKEFALSILHSKYSAVLFHARKLKISVEEAIKSYDNFAKFVEEKVNEA